MAKNSVNITKNSNGSKTVTETYSVESRGKTHTVTQSRTSLSSGSVFALFVFLLLIFSFFKLSSSSEPVTFEALLNIFSSAPSVDMSLSSFSVINPVQWGDTFSGLATFVNYFINIFNVIIYAFKGLYQVVIYFLYFIRFLFV